MYSVILSVRKVIVICLLVFSSISSAVTITPAAPQLAAKSYMLIDANSGHIIVESNIDKKLPPASLTKMMTAYIVAQELAEGRISADDQVPISVKAWRTGGSKMFIREGTQVSVGNLLKGIIIQSGNDASVAMAEYLAGSEDAFVDRMNSQAKALGLSSTSYNNATGFPAENHYTTARDLARLAQSVIFDYPEHYEIYSEKTFKYNNISQRNRNTLLWNDPSVDGIKTGYTEEAGYCLVSSADKDGMRLIAVVMGTQSKNVRIQESQKLLTYGFRYFDTRVIYKKDQSLTETKIWKGSTDAISLGLKDPLILTIPRGRQDDIEANMILSDVIEAPIEKGVSLGTVEVKLDNEVLYSGNLVALENIPEGSFWTWLLDSIRLFINSLIS